MVVVLVQHIEDALTRVHMILVDKVQAPEHLSFGTQQIAHIYKYMYKLHTRCDNDAMGHEVTSSAVFWAYLLRRLYQTVRSDQFELPNTYIFIIYIIVYYESLL